MLSLHWKEHRLIRITVWRDHRCIRTGWLLHGMSLRRSRWVLVVQEEAEVPAHQTSAGQAHPAAADLEGA